MRTKQLEEQEEREWYKVMHDSQYLHQFRRHSNHYTEVLVPFFICAPKKDMSAEGMKLTGSFLTKDLPDPIVLHFVKDGFLVVSKWGLEGEDASLTNENMN
jgi:hypothetical protein